MNDKLKRLETLLDTLPEEEIRESLRRSLLFLFVTYDREAGGHRLLDPEEDFPSGADFIEQFIENLPDKITRALDLN